MAVDTPQTYTVAFRSVSDGVIVEREITALGFDITSEGRLQLFDERRNDCAAFEPKTWAYILPKVI